MGGAGGRGEWRRAQCISTLKQTVSELYLGNGGIVVLYPIYHSSKRSHNGPVVSPIDTCKHTCCSDDQRSGPKGLKVAE